MRWHWSAGTSKRWPLTGIQTSGWETDIASVAGGRAAVQVAIATFGSVDVVVNNAGFAFGGGDLREPNQSELEALMAVHFLAAVGTMSAANTDMQKRSWGRIINTVSEVALDTRIHGSIGYAAAEAALWSATINAAQVGAEHGITVNAISPGARTRMNAKLLDKVARSAPTDDPAAGRQTRWGNRTRCRARCITSTS